MKELVELLIKEKWLTSISSITEVTIALRDFSGKQPTADESLEAWNTLQEVTCYQ